MALKLEGYRKRHLRIRKKVFGTAERPRLSVYRSLKNLYVQLVDDVNGKTLLGLSTQAKTFRQMQHAGGNITAAQRLGEVCCAEMKKKGIQKIVFDRGGHLYHGRLKALAEALRKDGIQF